MTSWLYLAVAIVAEVIATSALKSSDGFRRLGPSALVVAGYGTAFFLLSLALRAIPIGVAYAVWSGVGTALITIVGWVVFGQKLGAAGAVDIGLIVAGVVVLNAFTRGTGH